MKPPPYYLEPILRNIESVVLEIHEEYPKLIDKDIEWVYEKLVDYFKLKSRGKAKDEPSSPTERKQALLDEILNAIDEREETKKEEHLINNSEYTQGEHLYSSLEQVYVQIFKRLKDSCRFWRKENGAKGYIKFIRKFI